MVFRLHKIGRWKMIVSQKVADKANTDMLKTLEHTYHILKTMNNGDFLNGGRDGLIRRISETIKKERETK